MASQLKQYMVICTDIQQEIYACYMRHAHVDGHNIDKKLCINDLFAFAA